MDGLCDRRMVLWHRHHLLLSVQVRAGESAADAAGIGYSNPVNKQSRYAELTTLGKQQVVKRLVPGLLPYVQNSSVWVWSCISTCSYQTAEMICSAVGLTQSRLVPEYSFLDPRCLVHRHKLLHASWSWDD